MKHARLKGKELTLSSVQTMMANSRSTVEEAYPGDVIGVANPAGTFAIGDTIYTGSKRISYSKIPSFSPEVRVACRRAVVGVQHLSQHLARARPHRRLPRPSPLTPNHDIRHATPAPLRAQVFARCINTSPAKSKQFSKGISQLLDEGAVQQLRERGDQGGGGARSPLEPARATRCD